MEKILNVMSIDLQIHKSFPPILEINAIGNTSSLGWTNAHLSPYIYVKPPQDGYYEFDFVAEPPSGFAGQIITPIQAHPFSWIDFPATLKGVRVFAKSNSIEQQILNPRGRVELTGGESANPRGLFHHNAESEYLTAYAMLNTREQPARLTITGSMLTYRENDKVRFVKAEPQGIIPQVLILNVEIIEGTGGMKGTVKTIPPLEITKEAETYTHVLINYKLGTKTIAIHRLE